MILKFIFDLSNFLHRVYTRPSDQMKFIQFILIRAHSHFNIICSKPTAKLQYVDSFYVV
jgi:hypothetical protein